MRDSKIQLEQALLEIGILSDLSHKTRLLHDRTMRMMKTDITLAKNGVDLASDICRLVDKIAKLEYRVDNIRIAVNKLENERYTTLQEVTQHHDCS